LNEEAAWLAVDASRDLRAVQAAADERGLTVAYLSADPRTGPATPASA
jgi:hypothetical protein